MSTTQPIIFETFPDQVARSTRSLTCFVILCGSLFVSSASSEANENPKSCTTLSTQAIPSDVPYFKTWRTRAEFHTEGYPRFVLPVPEMKGKKILDVACGQGGLIHELRTQHGIQIWGVDKATGAQYREVLPWFVEGDATALPFADGEFDVIYNSWAMFASAYLKEETDEFLIQVLQEMNRVLKIGGEARIMPLSSLTLDRFKRLLKKAGGFDFQILDQVPLPFHEPPRTNYSVRLKKISNSPR